MSGIAAIGALAVIVGTATTVLIAELIERVSSSRDHGRSRRPDPRRLARRGRPVV